MKMPYLLIWILLSTVTLISACKPVQPVFNDTIETQGGLVELSIVSVDKNTAKRALQAITKDFAYLDHNWRVGGMGEIDRINRLISSNQAIATPPSLLPLIRLSQRFAANSRGTFNPAMGELLELWGFHGPPVETHSPPSPAAIRDLMQANPTMQDLYLSGILLHSRNPKAKLDFTAILNGYGIDLAVARLLELGVQSASVTIGGATRAIGNRDGQPWKIPIHSPADGGILAFVELSEGEGESVVALGGDERSFLYENNRYHELLDPRTGYPAMQTRAVVVLHKNAVTADAAAHAMFVAGPKEWAQIARVMGISHALLVDKTGTIHMTPNMLGRLEMLGKSPKIEFSNPTESDHE